MQRSVAASLECGCSARCRPAAHLISPSSLNRKDQRVTRQLVWPHLPQIHSQRLNAAQASEKSDPAAAPTLPPLPADLPSALRELDSLLAAEGDAAEAAAVQLVTRLKEGGLLKGYGAARQVPKRQYTLEELRLNKIDPTKFLSPQDETLDGVRSILQGGALAGATALYLSGTADGSQLLQAAVVALFLLTADQVANGGGVEALIVDSVGRVLSPTYNMRVAMHEAGHLLVAYLLGILPRAYTLTSWDAYSR